MGGLMSFSTQSLSTEDDLHRALSLIDALMGPDCHLLMSNGVEGTHFEKDADGAIEIIDQTLWEQQIQPLCGIDPDQRRHPAVPLNRRYGVPCHRDAILYRRVRSHRRLPAYTL